MLTDVCLHHHPDCRGPDVATGRCDGCTAIAIRPRCPLSFAPEGSALCSAGTCRACGERRYRHESRATAGRRPGEAA